MTRKRGEKSPRPTATGGAEQPNSQPLHEARSVSAGLPSRRQARLSAFLGRLMVRLGLLLALLALGCHGMFPDGLGRVGTTTFVVTGGTMVLVGWCASRLPLSLLMMSSVSTMTLVGGVLLLRAAGVNIERSYYQLWSQLHGPSRIGIWQADSRYGFAHRPGAVGFHTFPDFKNGKVKYTIDATGCRFTPAPARPKGTVLFLGCSYTFGHGVNDDECYPAILATRYWRDFIIRNRAVMAWGTDQAYLTLEEELPSLKTGDTVIYGWISHHQVRNAERKSWLDHLNHFCAINGQGWKKPLFEFQGKELLYRGVIGPEAAIPDDKMSRMHEAAISICLILGMQKLCAAKGVSFVVLLLPETEPLIFDDSPVLLTLHRHGIRMLDVGESSREFFATDPHPTSVAHAAIAAALARAVDPHRSMEIAVKTREGIQR